MKADASKQGAQALSHLHSFLSVHVIVNENHERKRQALFREDINSLFDAVIEEMELLPLEVRDESSCVVSHSYRECDEIGVDPNCLGFLLCLLPGTDFKWWSAQRERQNKQSASCNPRMSCSQG